MLEVYMLQQCNALNLHMLAGGIIRQSKYMVYE